MSSRHLLHAHMAEPAFGAVFAVPAVPIVFNADYRTVHILILAILSQHSPVCVLNSFSTVCTFIVFMKYSSGSQKAKKKILLMGRIVIIEK